MSHTPTEHLTIEIHNMGAWLILQDIYRAQAAEWHLDWPEESTTPAEDRALTYLTEAGLIEARPYANAPYNQVPTDRCDEIFALHYEGDREPRFADTAVLGEAE